MTSPGKSTNLRWSICDISTPLYCFDMRSFLKRSQICCLCVYAEHTVEGITAVSAKWVIFEWFNIKDLAFRWRFQAYLLSWALNQFKISICLTRQQKLSIYIKQKCCFTGKTVILIVAVAAFRFFWRRKYAEKTNYQTLIHSSANVALSSRTYRWT